MSTMENIYWDDSHELFFSLSLSLDQWRSQKKQKRKKEKKSKNEIFSKCHRSYQLFIMYCSMRRLHWLRLVNRFGNERYWTIVCNVLQDRKLESSSKRRWRIATKASRDVFWGEEQTQLSQLNLRWVSWELVRFFPGLLLITIDWIKTDLIRF